MEVVNKLESQDVTETADSLSSPHLDGSILATTDQDLSIRTDRYTANGS